MMRRVVVSKFNKENETGHLPAETAARTLEPHVKVKKEIKTPFTKLQLLVKILMSIIVISVFIHTVNQTLSLKDNGSNESKFSNLDGKKDFVDKKPGAVKVLKEPDALSCLDEHESQCLTFPTFKPIKEDLAEFMSTQGNTNGGRFVKLLREYLYADPNWEMDRLSACYKSRDVIKCFAGIKQYNSATAPDQVKMPFNDNDGENDVIFAREMNRYRDTNHTIHFLGTGQTCLPFLLAGTTITAKGAIIELGPFAGFSSKCLATGLRSTGPPRDNSMLVYDSYNDIYNYRAIRGHAPWVRKVYPDFTEKNTDFLQLWKDTVQYVYPKAEPKQMYATTETLHDGVLGENILEVFVIDSAKSVFDFHKQMGNLTIHAGSVFFTNDFQQAKDNIFLFYSCLRNIMIPVFSSFLEQWVWVVKKTFKLNQSWVKKCYAQISENDQEARDIMKRQAADDIAFLLSGLRDNDLLTDQSTNTDTKIALEYWKKRSMDVVIPYLGKTTFNWENLITSF
jgi:hypothetical protein